MKKLSLDIQHPIVLPFQNVAHFTYLAKLLPCMWYLFSFSVFPFYVEIM